MPRDGTRSARVHRVVAPLEPPVAVLVSPQGDRAADDLPGRSQAEVAAVETVADLPVHQEHRAGGNAFAALPDRQVTARAIAFERRSHLDAVDGDDQAGAADRLSGDCKNALHQRHAFGDMAACGEEHCQHLRRVDGDQFRHVETVGRRNRVEADRRAGRCVPDQLGRHRREAGITDADRCERRCGDEAEARHGPVLRRFSQASCRDGV